MDWDLGFIISKFLTKPKVLESQASFQQPLVWFTIKFKVTASILRAFLSKILFFCTFLNLHLQTCKMSSLRPGCHHKYQMGSLSIHLISM